jgi:Arc/MetJ family transcription regulator
VPPEASGGDAGTVRRPPGPVKDFLPRSRWFVISIYLVTSIKKTALLLDGELIDQVRQLLGTRSTTDTIHAALREVIQVQGRARHFERLSRRELARGGDAPR